MKIPPVSPWAVAVPWKRCPFQGRRRKPARFPQGRRGCCTRPQPSPCPLLLCALRGHRTGCPQDPPLAPGWAGRCGHLQKAEGRQKARGHAWVTVGAGSSPAVTAPGNRLPPGSGTAPPLPSLWGLSALDNQPHVRNQRCLIPRPQLAASARRKCPQMTGTVSRWEQGRGPESSLRPAGAAAVRPALRLMAGKPGWFWSDQAGVRAGRPAKVTEDRGQRAGTLGWQTSVQRGRGGPASIVGLGSPQCQTWETHLMGRQQQTLERPGYLHPGVSGCHRTRRWRRCYQGNTGPPASLRCSRGSFSTSGPVPPASQSLSVC
nr:uncharacterized protein LOC115841590 [Globicephala melas]XP_060153735.1 uncharacterized protein LOC115841590 [Globicephala melas]XP_060153736.1 uncharacterized protein LOC115841590 [Globicephala melas]XP_060153737.1 uncharacterized protein LOC115841590 [Globicephala melas]XP_060153738.1 uncharacterized protein LOC115841590 [Globicephala melas]XP_060153739.1 uncharacterized protein LOC115841590 [Globicephala melas]XP_060153740.1 uncharacterized protein LOC115841590 [Globicephala melas]XP_0